MVSSRSSALRISAVTVPVQWRPGGDPATRLQPLPGVGAAPPVSVTVVPVPSAVTAIAFASPGVAKTRSVVACAPAPKLTVAACAAATDPRLPAKVAAKAIARRREPLINPHRCTDPEDTLAPLR